MLGYDPAFLAGRVAAVGQYVIFVIVENHHAMTILPNVLMLIPPPERVNLC